ncbi:MAG: dUTP diphosphatase [Spirochaetia bacterium]|nr:dUTP diphosphatase [Spirochaetia bacterium]
MSNQSQKISVAFRKCHSNAEIPLKQTPGSAGYDIKAFLDEPVAIQPGERKSIATGIRVEIPTGFVLSIRPRSGLAINHGVTMINSPGTIDSDYRGEIKVLMVNLGTESFVINHGDRIAQVLLEKAFEIEWNENYELEETVRGEKGFGSTGRK